MPAPNVTITQTPGPYAVPNVDYLGWRFAGSLSQGTTPVPNWYFQFSVLVQTPANIQDAQDRLPLITSAVFQWPLNEYPTLSDVNAKIQQLYNFLVDNFLVEFGV